jgi:hypothetical protein
MARTTIAAATPSSLNTSTPTGLDAVAAGTAADTTNFNATPHSGKLLLIARNTDASAHHVTINSVADPFGRTGDVNADTIAANGVKVYGPFPASGWQQGTDGTLHYQADSALVYFTPIALP